MLGRTVALAGCAGLAIGRGALYVPNLLRGKQDTPVGVSQIVPADMLWTVGVVWIVMGVCTGIGAALRSRRWWWYAPLLAGIGGWTGTYIGAAISGDDKSWSGVIFWLFLGVIMLGALITNPRGERSEMPLVPVDLTKGTVPDE